MRASRALDTHAKFDEFSSNARAKAVTPSDGGTVVDWPIVQRDDEPATQQANTFTCVRIRTRSHASLMCTR
jgi:hypothetical protein